jgi:hypothetical protein
MAQDEVGTAVPQGQEVAQQVPTPPAPEATDTGVLAEQPGQKEGSAQEGSASEGDESAKVMYAERLVPPGASVG